MNQPTTNEIDNKDLHANAIKLKLDNAELKEKNSYILTNLDQAKVLLNNAENEKRQLNSKLKKADADVEKYQASINKKIDSYQSLRSEYDSLQQKYVFLENDNSKLKKERDKFTEINSTLSKENSRIGEECAYFMEKNSALSKTNNVLMQRVSAVVKDRIIWFLMVLILVLLALTYFLGVGYLLASNLSAFSIDPAVLVTINKAMNVGTEIAIPFLFGCVGALTRVMIADVGNTKSVQLVVASGIIAAFSWVSIKSKLFISIVAPHLLNGEKLQAQTTSDGEIYTLVLVSALVGMFATNIYIFIDQRVRQLTAEAINIEKGKQPK